MDNFTFETEVDLTVSNGSSTEDSAQPVSESKTTVVPKEWYQGHSFVKKNLHKPAACHHCSDHLWGILGTTGMVCEVCNFLAHEKCMRAVVAPCTCITPFLIRDPVPHCWSEIGHFKRKFCNVCRKRVDDLLALRCEICEYYSHYECLDFASADCKQCAVSTLTTTPKTPTNMMWTNDTRYIYTQSRLLRCSPKPDNYGEQSNEFGTELNESAQSIIITCGNITSNETIKYSSICCGSPTATTSTSGAAAATSAAAVAVAVAMSGGSSAISNAHNVGQSTRTISTDGISTEETDSQNKSPTSATMGVHPNNQTVILYHQSHHWREGNLPVNSKCMSCRKTCWSAECLTGIRCEWCGATTHYSCLRQVPTECDFGVLRDIILPPNCVSVPRTSLLVEQIIGMTKPQPENLMGVQALTDEFSSSGDSPEESGIERRSVKDRMTDRDFDDYVRVYDGYARFRKRQCRYLSLGRSVSVLKVIELSLKAFQLPPDEADDYCLVEINEKDGSEHLLDSSSSFKSQLQFETRRPQILLRSRDRNNDREFIQTLPGTLGQYTDVDLVLTQVPVTRETTAHDAVQMALCNFGLEHLDATKFQLVETSLDRGLTERVMSSGERLWLLLERIKRESVRALRLTRFYVQPVDDINGPIVTIFVGNLKKGLSQRLYERILLERLGPENRWDSIEVIYYDFGSLVLVYLNAERADEAYHILKQSTFEDRPILAMILPRLKPINLPEGIQPLLVLVNVKSGGCQGIELITSFRKLLNPHQVFNLDYGGPLPGLHCFRQLKKFKILVCGGDGTVGWALSCLDNVGQDAACPTPPMAILPLGTGNDLARVLRWGSGYTGGEEPLTILRDVVEAENIRLDRWTVVIKPDQAERDAQKKQLQIEAHTSNTNEDSSRIFVMNNYFGLGIDADLNLDFHMAREENPAKFNSRIHNKSVYLKMGLRKMVNRTKCKDLHLHILVEVDGKQLDLPPLEGVIILNILSWGAGANPWGVEKDEAFHTPTHYDGQLEVVGVTGVVHMGQIFSGLRTGIRLAQGGHIRITVKSDIPVQVDGEPWIQPPGQIVVLRSALKATMLKKRKRRKVNRRHTEPGLGGPGSPSSASTPNHQLDLGSEESSVSCSIFGASGPPPATTTSPPLTQQIRTVAHLPTTAMIDNRKLGPIAKETENIILSDAAPCDVDPVDETTTETHPRLYRFSRPVYANRGRRRMIKPILMPVPSAPSVTTSPSLLDSDELDEDTNRASETIDDSPTDSLTKLNELAGRFGLSDDDDDEDEEEEAEEVEVDLTAMKQDPDSSVPIEKSDSALEKNS